MEELVQQIIQNSKAREKSMNPRQMFFREFDQALQLASQGLPQVAWNDLLMKLEQYGRQAGLSTGELASRKKTLFWTVAQAA